jgi:hypothetical protein
METCRRVAQTVWSRHLQRRQHSVSISLKLLLYKPLRCRSITRFDIVIKGFVPPNMRIQLMWIARRAGLPKRLQQPHLIVKLIRQLYGERFACDLR